MDRRMYVWVVWVRCREIWVLFFFFFFLIIRRPPRSTRSRSSAASDVYKRQLQAGAAASLGDIVCWLAAGGLQVVDVARVQRTGGEVFAELTGADE